MTLKSKTRKATKPAASPKTTAAAKAPRKSKTTVAEAPKAVKSASPAAASSKRTAVKSPAAKPEAKKPVASKVTTGKQEVTFNLFAPTAGSVLVAGDFTQWESSPISLVQDGSGHWKTTVALKPGRYEYRLLVDGEWQNDPGCPEVQQNEFGSSNCVLSVAA